MSKRKREDDTDDKVMPTSEESDKLLQQYIACAGSQKVFPTPEEIERVDYASLSEEDFIAKYWNTFTPVILTGGMEDWPCRKWTLQHLREKEGERQVFARTRVQDISYQLGQRIPVEQMRLKDYCTYQIEGNKRARNYYLAVQNIKTTFPSINDDVRLPKFIKKMHRGPYLWLAPSGHYEFNHYDPDDNFLCMIAGEKQIRLAHPTSLAHLYPNDMGSKFVPFSPTDALQRPMKGYTIQSRVKFEEPSNAENFPDFSKVEFTDLILKAGEMLYIPVYYWHQVSSIENCISMTMFYGGENNFLDRVMSSPETSPSFIHWFLNIGEQNKEFLGDLNELTRDAVEVGLSQFFHRQYKSVPSPQQMRVLADELAKHYGITFNPKGAKKKAKFKVRGLLHR